MLELAQQIAVFLEPAIPFLIIGGTKAAEKAGEKLGVDGWEKAKAVWRRLCSDNEDSLGEISRDLAIDPENEDVRQEFLSQLRSLIETNPNLVTELASLTETRIAQKVLAEQNSSIKNIKQSTTGGSNVCFEVIARNGSNIEDVEQKHNA